MEEFIFEMANLKALQCTYIPGLKVDCGHIAALGQHEGHLRPPLLEAAQVEGEEIVWSGQARVKSSQAIFSPLKPASVPSVAWSEKPPMV